MTLHELHESTGMTLDRIRVALMALKQRNLARCTEHEAHKQKPVLKVTRYTEATRWYPVDAA